MPFFCIAQCRRASHSCTTELLMTLFSLLSTLIAKWDRILAGAAFLIHCSFRLLFLYDYRLFFGKKPSHPLIESKSYSSSSACRSKLGLLLAGRLFGLLWLGVVFLLLPIACLIRCSCAERAYELLLLPNGILEGFSTSDPALTTCEPPCISLRASWRCWANGERLRSTGPFQ